MNISKLETFLTLSKCLHFTEAAEQLYISQPAVSMQTQSLEEYLGVPLFDRIGKKLYLTKHGEQFKPYAEQIINLLHSAKDHLQQLDNLTVGTLSFGSSNFVGVYLLPALLATFKATFPTINISMKITSSNQLLHALEANEVEFLILSDQVPIDHTKFIATTFYQDELVLIAPASHPLAKKVECSWEDILHENFLLKPQKSATRTFLENKWKDIGGTISTYMEISSLEGIKQGVIHGLGISILSRFAVSQEIASGLLVEIPIKEVTFKRGINYVYHKNKHLPPAATEFISLLEKI